MLRIANAAGFPGDRIDAARQIVDRVEVDYLTLNELSETTMPVLAVERETDSSRGYTGDFLDILQNLGSAVYLQPQLKIVTDAGGANPRACAESAASILVQNGSPDLAVGFVIGDDLLDRLEELIAAGCALENSDTGAPFTELRRPIVAANAVLGGEPIATLLDQGARLVITGRMAKSSLAVGPAVHTFRWGFSDWRPLAAATVVGHLIECGSQVAGGNTASWSEFDLADAGYPIAELNESGCATIKKPPGTGGVVTRQTVVEQLLYRIGDPARYVTPDVEVDLTTVQVTERGPDEVEIQGAMGRAAPAAYSVSLDYHAGFTATALFLVEGRDNVEKARAAADIIFTRTEAAGWKLDTKRVELFGAAAGVAGSKANTDEPRELVLRITAQSERREAVERFTREVTPVAHTGLAGLAPLADQTTRPQVRPVFAHWPTQVPKDAVEPIVDVRMAKEWC